METEQKYGPQTEQVEALIAVARSLTAEQRRVLGAAWYAARDAAWDIWDAAWDSAGRAAWYAVLALAVRDQIGNTFTQSHYDILTTPWRRVIGPIHPDDADI